MISALQTSSSAVFEYLLIPQEAITKLLETPASAHVFMLQGSRYRLSLGIVGYAQHLQNFYGAALQAGFSQAESLSGIEFCYQHFGLFIHFESPVQITMHSPNDELLGNSRRLIETFGFVAISNAYLPESIRDNGHRNRFPHLNFHRDRNSAQPTPYSLYTRNPFDPEQCQPRISSTLVTANLVGYLQSMRQGDYEKTRELQSHYDLFGCEDMSEVIGRVVVEQRWDQPLGCGEIAMLDNRKVLHSSYIRQPPAQGYRIGVRYLS